MQARLFERVVNRIHDGMLELERKTVDEYKETSEIYKGLQKALASNPDEAKSIDIINIGKAATFEQLLKLTAKYNINNAPIISGLALNACMYTASIFSSSASFAYYLTHMHEDVKQFAAKKGYFDTVANLPTRSIEYQLYLDARIRSLEMRMQQA